MKTGVINNIPFYIPSRVTAEDGGWFSITTDTTAGTAGTVGWRPENSSHVSADEISQLATLAKRVEELDALFYRQVLVKCSCCGQWGAAMTACKSCGYPIDLGEDSRK